MTTETPTLDGWALQDLYLVGARRFCLLTRVRGDIRDSIQCDLPPEAFAWPVDELQPWIMEQIERACIEMGLPITPVDEIERAEATEALAEALAAWPGRPIEAAFPRHA